MDLPRLFPRATAKPLLALLLGLCANSSMAANLTESLTQCQPAFFKTLYSQRGELARVVKLAQDDKRGLAWVPVADRRETQTALQSFSKPLDDQGLRLTGYYDRVFDLGEMGTYYFWGFEVDASREAIMAVLPQAGWQEAGSTLFLGRRSSSVPMHHGRTTRQRLRALPRHRVRRRRS